MVSRRTELDSVCIMLGINTEERTRLRMTQELLSAIPPMLQFVLITGLDRKYVLYSTDDLTFRKSASWVGGSDDDDDDDFFDFGNSMYSDSADSRAKTINSISFTRNRAKITNAQVKRNRKQMLSLKSLILMSYVNQCCLSKQIRLTLILKSSFL